MTKLAEPTQRVSRLSGPRTAGAWHLAIKALIAVVAVVLIVIGVLEVSSVDPLTAWYSVWNSTFGTTRNFAESLIRAAPLLIIALTLVPSLRAGLYNIGAPGQMAIGALFVTATSLHTSHLPQWIELILCMVVASIGGALVALVPGVLKAWFRINEIITSLAMNFVAIAIIGWLLNGPMKSGFGNLPQSDELPNNASLPIIIPDTRAHIGLVVALLFVPLIWALDRSRTGYRLRIFSANPQLARQATISRRKYLVGLMAFGGVGGGLAGWMQVAAIDHRLYPTLADPVGYAGLFVALLGALIPVAIIAASLVLGALLHGGDGLQVGANVSPEIVQVVLGLILLAYAVTRNSSGQSSETTTRRRLWTSFRRS